MRYVLIKSEIGDLYCQKTILEEFALQYIKNNGDGNMIAQVYLDFISAVDYLQSLDKNMLRDPELGCEYLRDYNLHCLENRLYMYPEDDQTDELGSQATTYNIFGGFKRT